MSVDELAYQKLIHTLEKNVAVYEKILSKQRYLAGDVRFFLTLTLMYSANMHP